MNELDWYKENVTGVEVVDNHHVFTVRHSYSPFSYTEVKLDKVDVSSINSLYLAMRPYVELEVSRVLRVHNSGCSIKWVLDEFFFEDNKRYLNGQVIEGDDFLLEIRVDPDSIVSHGSRDRRLCDCICDEMEAVELKNINKKEGNVDQVPVFIYLKEVHESERKAIFKKFEGVHIFFTVN